MIFDFKTVTLTSVLLTAKHPSFSGQGNSAWATHSPFGVPFPTSWNAAAGMFYVFEFFLDLY